ncbi:hypothetical protein L1987_20348 [Smallanthus sonchifolius]|uniref:Uncharacterized protein n=1 Tax=Smallanthus sonchifolius TaxID=185202 RepID=A0ACB9ISD0_9ASTR|nr:hypothetical protein L1987_20348 [Smallanthus sonchifolius]
MVSAPLHASRTIDWPLMGQLGVRERLQQLLPPHWRQLLDVPREQYVELPLEFFSTYRLHRGDLTAATVVEFSLGGVLHHMSISQFASRIGLYNEAETGSGARAARPPGSAIRCIVISTALLHARSPITIRAQM